MNKEVILNKGAELSIDKKAFDLLKKEYTRAVLETQEDFVFQGHTIDTGYAKYLVEYLSPQFNNQ